MSMFSTFYILLFTHSFLIYSLLSYLLNLFSFTPCFPAHHNYFSPSFPPRYSLRPFPPQLPPRSTLLPSPIASPSFISYDTDLMSFNNIEFHAIHPSITCIKHRSFSMYPTVYNPIQTQHQVLTPPRLIMFNPVFFLNH